MRIIKLTLLVIGILVLLVICYAIFGNFSEGARAGVVTKLSKRGYVFKTYEGQLNQGGFADETGTFIPTTWNFSVKPSEEQVLALLDDAQLNGGRVKLFYREKFIRFFWMGDTKYYVYKVEKLPVETSK